MTAELVLRVPVQSRSQKTRAVLLAAARREFSRSGYAAATAKTIAARARVGTGTFYHYFPDKDAALLEITKERVQNLLDESFALAQSALLTNPSRLAKDAEPKLAQLVKLYLDYHRADRGLHAVIAERRLCDPSIDAIMAASEREGVRRIAAELAVWGHEGDVESAAFMIFSLLEGAVHGHVFSKPIVSDERFTAALVKAMLRIGMPGRPLAIRTSSRSEKTS